MIATTAHQNRLPVSNRTVFIDLKGLRAVLGEPADRIKDMVDNGQLLWTFNLGHAKGTQRRDLRFWLPEVLNQTESRKLRLEEVLRRILPTTRTRFSGAEISQIFLVSRQTVQRIGAQTGGKVEKRVLYVGRLPLADFLKGRWLGADALADSPEAKP